MRQSTIEFRQQLQALPRNELLEIIGDQNPDVLQQVQRIEWVFANKLQHLFWPNGDQITERPLTNEELALLIDEPFTFDKELARAGINREQQEELHFAEDPVLWARFYLQAKPRAYQILIMRHPSLRKVLRAGRRLGKSWCLACILLHYSWTRKDGRYIVVAPMKEQAGLIYKEVLDLASKNDLIQGSITRKVASPQFEIDFSTGSVIKFFTSGMKTASKSDVVRGQEAHIIILDELDYMHPDDLEALYAMLQKTSEDQEDKILIGASTPTGRREHFWTMCNSSRYKEFWFPSYCNPYFSKETEDEFHLQYTEMGYRHEVEADWGEDVDGVYSRRFVDAAFLDPGWDYISRPQSARSKFIIGVDWDKYGAGTNIVVLEMCDENYEEERFQGKVRLCHREEVPKDEYTFTNAVDRIIELNSIFQPEFIYVDRGSGEVQVELLHKHGIEHPETKLRERVRGVQFSETLEVIDPHTRQPIKKDIKPFMVDNLTQMLERQQIVFPINDERTFRDSRSLYMQLISYIVARTTPIGKPVFEASGTAEDHAHDALILACLAITQNYSDLMKRRVSTTALSVSHEAFLPTFEVVDGNEEEAAEKIWGDLNSAPINKKRLMTVSLSKKTPGRPIRRSSF